MRRESFEGWDLRLESEPDAPQSAEASHARPAVSLEVLEALREIGVPMDGDDADPGTETGDAVAWQLLAHCLEEMGEAGGAERCYRRAARRMIRSRSEVSGATPVDPIPFAVFRPTRDDLGH